MRAPGFTLIEVLVASALSLVVISLVFESMMSAQRITTLTRAQSANFDTLQSVAGIIGDDVRRASFIQPDLSAPTWLNVARSSTIQSLNLRAEPGAECPTRYDVVYYLVPRTELTGMSDQWLHLPDDGRNTTQSVLLRARRCGTDVLTRVVADYLTDTTFAIAQAGSTTYTATPSASTGGYPYLSVRINIARSFTTRNSTVREPQTGTLRFVAASRTVEIP